MRPLGRKAYGSIAHLPGSRMGPSDHHCHKGQELICTQKTRDKHDQVIVQEKLDGSCVAVARLNGQLIPLSRSGYTALSSRYEQHHHFHHWVIANESRFMETLEEGERIVGEWLAQAHSTRYRIDALFEPFHAFDIIRADVSKTTPRLSWNDFVERICFATRPLCSTKFLGYGPMTPEQALALDHNPWRLDPPEGVIYRVERHGKVDFLAKYVRPDKVDGVYLPIVTNGDPVWNWQP